MSQIFHAAVLLILPLAVIVAAMRDLTSYTIPNWISLVLIAAFPVGALATGLSLQEVGMALGVGAAALVAGIVMFSLGWIGGGDAKLFAACGLWLGLQAALPFLMWTALAGGALALALLWGRDIAKPIVGYGPSWFGRLMAKDGDVPYGLAICFGALAAFPQSLIAHTALL